MQFCKGLYSTVYQVYQGFSLTLVIITGCNNKKNESIRADLITLFKNQSN